MRPTAVVVATMWAALALVACAQPERPSAGGQIPASSPGQVRSVAEQDANLHLWVSNQSFQDPTVVVKVSIDGVEVVSQPFEVQGQHNWILFPVEVAPGSHVLNVVTDTNTEMTQTFTLADTKRQYAVVNYWNDQGGVGRHLDWHIQPTPIGFA